MGTELSVADLKNALQRMMLMRRVEEEVIDLASSWDDQIRGHFHVYIGQEASGLGSCLALGPDDYVFTTHRNHGHVIARGGDAGPVTAEIIGRTTGYNKGRGGTFHVIAKHLGILQTSAIVGGCVALAAGAAFSIKTRGTKQVSLAFFGDGVLEEGVFHESINMASLWKLPIIFLCENNSVPAEGRRQGEYPSASLAATQIADIPRAMNIETHVVDGTDLRAVHSLLVSLVDRTRKGEGPFFVESRLTKWPGSQGQEPELIGGRYQIEWAWNPQQADPGLQEWVRDSDPVSLLARALEDENLVSRADIEALDTSSLAEAAAAKTFALESPIPAPEAAMDHIFA